MQNGVEWSVDHGQEMLKMPLVRTHSRKTRAQPRGTNHAADMTKGNRGCTSKNDSDVPPRIDACKQRLPATWNPLVRRIRPKEVANKPTFG